MMKAQLRRIIILAFLIFLIIRQVNAVGIYTPWDKEFDFKPGLEKTLDFAVSSSKYDVRLSVSGYLSEYITLSKTIIKSDSTERAFKAIIKLPKEVEKPGHHKVWVIAEEIIDESKASSTIGTSSNVMVYILIHILNPGKYIDMSLSAPNVNLNEPVNFAVNVKSFGKQDIGSIKAAIEVYSPDNKKLTTVYTEEKSLKSNAEETLHALFDTKGYLSGTYNAIAKLNYDGKTKEDEENFKIGELNIKIINYTKEFEKDKINKFNVEIESDWGNKMENTYGKIKVNNEIIKTPNIDLGPWEKKTITTYWDTKNVEIGSYDAEITIYYESKTTVETGKVSVVKKKEVLVEKPGAITISLSTTTILILIIILLIIIDIIWITKKGRSKRKQKVRKK